MNNNKNKQNKNSANGNDNIGTNLNNVIKKSETFPRTNSVLYNFKKNLENEKNMKKNTDLTELMLQTFMINDTDNINNKNNEVVHKNINNTNEYKIKKFSKIYSSATDILNNQKNNFNLINNNVESKLKNKPTVTDSIHLLELIHLNKTNSLTTQQKALLEKKIFFSNNNIVSLTPLSNNNKKKLFDFEKINNLKTAVTTSNKKELNNQNTDTDNDENNADNNINTNNNNTNDNNNDNQNKPNYNETYIIESQKFLNAFFSSQENNNSKTNQNNKNDNTNNNNNKEKVSIKTEKINNENTNNNNSSPDINKKRKKNNQKQKKIIIPHKISDIERHITQLSLKYSTDESNFNNNTTKNFRLSTANSNTNSPNKQRIKKIEDNKSKSLNNIQDDGVQLVVENNA